MNPRGSRVDLCPSAQPEWPGAAALGVVGGTAAEPRVRYLADAQPITPELLALADPVTPGEVFRFAAPCMNGGCIHFQSRRCSLAERIVNLLPEVTEGLPACSIRDACRWWRQEGAAACHRCPQVVTDNFHPSERMRTAAQDRATAAKS